MLIRLNSKGNVEFANYVLRYTNKEITQDLTDKIRSDNYGFLKGLSRKEGIAGIICFDGNDIKHISNILIKAGINVIPESLNWNKKLIDNMVGKTFSSISEAVEQLLIIEMPKDKVEENTEITFTVYSAPYTTDVEFLIETFDSGKWHKSSPLHTTSDSDNIAKHTFSFGRASQMRIYARYQEYYSDYHNFEIISNLQ